jgi:hypothetical protein
MAKVTMDTIYDIRSDPRRVLYVLLAGAQDGGPTARAAQQAQDEKLAEFFPKVQEEVVEVASERLAKSEAELEKETLQQQAYEGMLQVEEFAERAARPLGEHGRPIRGGEQEARSRRQDSGPGPGAARGSVHSAPGGGADGSKAALRLSRWEASLTSRKRVIQTPPAIFQTVFGSMEFCEVRLYGVLRSSGTKVPYGKSAAGRGLIP